MSNVKQMFKKQKISLTQTTVRDMIESRKEGNIMKKNLKIIALIYVGVAILTYALTLRVDKLESMEDQTAQNKRVVLKLK